MATCCQQAMNGLKRSCFQSESWSIRTKERLSLLPVFLSHRSSTRQRHGRCSKCLRRLTKSCMRGAAAEEGYSRGCRMNVSNGPHVSHTFGTLPTNLLTLYSWVNLGRSEIPIIIWLMFACHSGSWGLSWCVPVMRASSGLLLQGKQAARQPAGRAAWSPRRKWRAAQSKSQPRLSESSRTHNQSSAVRVVPLM